MTLDAQQNLLKSNATRDARDMANAMEALEEAYASEDADEISAAAWAVLCEWRQYTRSSFQSMIDMVEELEEL